jgi:hypothetical protein
MYIVGMKTSTPVVFTFLIPCRHADWALLYIFFPGAALEDPKTEDLSQEVRGFIFFKILVRSLFSGHLNFSLHQLAVPVTHTYWIFYWSIGTQARVKCWDHGIQRLSFIINSTWHTWSLGTQRYFFIYWHVVLGLFCYLFNSSATFYIREKPFIFGLLTLQIWVIRQHRGFFKHQILYSQCRKSTRLLSRCWKLLVVNVRFFWHCHIKGKWILLVTFISMWTILICFILHKSYLWVTWNISS